MNDPLVQFQRQAAQVGRAVAPRVDVTDRVLADIGNRRQTDSIDVQLLVVGAAAALAAGVAASVSWRVWSSLQDPMLALMEPFQMVMQ